MKNILLIGVGGTGSNAVDIFFQKKEELGNQTDNNITALVFDTDAGDLKRITAAKTVEMADNASVGTICDRLGTEYLREWFPCDDKAVRAQEMHRGASQWRKKSYLAFLNLMNKPLARSTFISALEDMTQDPGASCEIYIIASVAGGTGSGSFIPIALYAKQYLRKVLGKDPIVNAMIALPDIYAKYQTPENRIKVYSNAYAILRELNAINLVSRNYNAGLAEHKKAPIRFRIGDPKEPSVGLLFDASDKQFWTPEAAPFSQVFLLDHIPGLDSISAHDIVLANSLYTILCTEIGSAFDSEFSNHELLRSQNNGSNAIYAGISTSQIRFPKDSVLDYLAHKKTLDSCEGEWLVLHNSVENAIKAKEQQEAEFKRRYIMEKGEYSKILIDKLGELVNDGNDEIISLLERAVYKYEEDKTRIDEGESKAYFEAITSYIDSRIPAYTEIEKTLDNMKPKKPRNSKKIEKGAVNTFAISAYQNILEYYISCVDNIKRISGSTADSILTLDKRKESFAGKTYSIIEKLIKRDDKYIHPVAALILLSYIRNSITDLLEKNSNVKEWEDIKKRHIEEIDDVMLELDKSNSRDSEYAKIGTNRFVQAYLKGDRFAKIETFDEKDIKILTGDISAIFNKIYTDAKKQIEIKVYTAVAKSLDILIAKYRNFFKRFEKEKEELVEDTKTAHRKDSGKVDSIINVFSSKDDKDSIYNEINFNAGPATNEEIEDTDNIVGKGVFDTVYNAAVSEFSSNKSWNEKDSKVYRSLFSDMVKAYRKSIEKSEAFEKIACYNAIEAIVATCGENPGEKKIDSAFRLKFAAAQEVATPSLRLEPGTSFDDIVNPSNHMVFMMSVNTGRYIKKHAEDFGLSMPADQANEDKVIKACAEEFIHRYSGNNSARVAIVTSMPDQVLYCTGEIMDISPLRISKFNELGNDNLYFKNYLQAIENFKKYGTDMWNPHLGNNLHKRGYLPYMNPEMEKECDVKVVKAILYGLQSKKIEFSGSTGSPNNYYFKHNGKKLTDCDGRWINEKLIAHLMTWMRNEDKLAEEWSVYFDKDILAQMNALPSLSGESPAEIKNLEDRLTKSRFMKLLNDMIYMENPKATNRPKRYVDDAKKPEPRNGPSAIEVAYAIKTSEELGRDCDDAERFIAVLYDVFRKMCEYRANPEIYPDVFVHVYKQQLDNFYKAFATSEPVVVSADNAAGRFVQLITWLNSNGLFKTVSEDTPMDEKGNVIIDSAYDYTKNSECVAVIKGISAKEKKDKKGETDDESSDKKD